MNARSEINRLVKRAVSYDSNGSGFTLSGGDTFSHVSKKTGIPVSSIIAANGGIDPRKARAGVRYVLPAASPKPANKPSKIGLEIFDVDPESTISSDGLKFKLPAGKTLSHVLRDYQKRFPDFPQETVQRIRQANGNLAPEKFQAGRVYNMPSTPYSPRLMDLLQGIMNTARKNGIPFKKPDYKRNYQ